MRIDATNYEAYWLDYLEGRLDPVIAAELMAFLAGHPSLDLNTESLPVLGKDDCVHIPRAEQLKKDFGDIRAITDDNFDEFCIAAHENLLGDREKQLLSEYCSRNTQRSADFEFYGKLKLVKEPEIRFPFRERLKKRTPAFRRMVYIALAAAAAVAAAVLLIRNDLPADEIQPVPEAGMNSMVADIPAPATEALPPGKPVQESEPLQLPLPAISHKSTDISSIHHREEAVVPSRIDPLVPEPFLSGDHAPALIVSAYLHFPDESGETGKGFGSDNLIARQVAFLARRLNLVKAAGAAIQGINYLTESELALAEVKDESGHRSGLVLETERRVISGTIPR